MQNKLQIINHPFEYDVAMLLTTMGLLILHYKNERLYFDHRIMMTDENKFELAVVIIT